MPDFIKDSALLSAFLFFFSIAFLRTLATYWIARYVAYTAQRHETIKYAWLEKIATWIRRSGEGRGVRTVERWGGLAVFASFFMSGTKTVVNAGAGLTRMRFGAYIFPLVAGCTAHGIIYATIGWAAWTSAARAAAGSPLGAAVFLLILACCVWLVVHLVRKRRRTQTDHAQEPTDSSEN